MSFPEKKLLRSIYIFQEFFDAKIHTRLPSRDWKVQQEKKSKNKERKIETFIYSCGQKSHMIHDAIPMWFNVVISLHVCVRVDWLISLRYNSMTYKGWMFLSAAEKRKTFYEKLWYKVAARVIIFSNMFKQFISL